MPPEDFVVLGKIVGVHGIRGNVRVASFAESPDVFETDRPFLVLDTQGFSHMHTVDWVKPYKHGLLMALHGIHDRQGAEAILQAEIYIRKSDLPAPEEDAYYWFDLIGLSVFTAENKYLGSEKSIIPTGSNDVYVVRDPNKDEDIETLIPALESVVLEIDVDQKIMRVDLPEGL